MDLPVAWGMTKREAYTAVRAMKPICRYSPTLGAKYWIYFDFVRQDGKNKGLFHNEGAIVQ